LRLIKFGIKSLFYYTASHPPVEEVGKLQIANSMLVQKNFAHSNVMGYRYWRTGVGFLSAFHPVLLCGISFFSNNFWGIEGQLITDTRWKMRYKFGPPSEKK